MTIQRRLCLGLALLITAGMVSACNRGSESVVQQESNRLSAGKEAASTTVIARSDGMNTTNSTTELSVSATHDPESPAPVQSATTAPMPAGTTRPPEEPTQPPAKSPIKVVSPSEQVPVWLVDNETDCDKLITRTYTLSELSDAVKFFWYAPTFYMSSRQWVQDLHASYPIECLRRMEDGRYYAIYKLEGGGRLYVFFADEGYYTHSLYWFPDEDPDDWNHLRDVDILARDAAQYDVQLARRLEVAENSQDSEEKNNALLLAENRKVLYSVHYTEDGLVQIRYTLKNGNADDSFYFSGSTMLHAEIALHEDYHVAFCEDTMVADFSILEQDMPV